MAKINLADEIAKALTEYTTEITEGIEKEKKRIAKGAVSILKKTSPEDTGDYAKGWKVSDINGKQVVHNKTDYQLTHLLEYGHAKVKGGRVEARPHIRQAEEKVIEEFTQAVKDVIQG
ncbi:HK97 gp10 family phage protein [Clostridium butyricum]|uniref:HK97 gp10 family phage protein n=1 Tax=Clostridium butyricum TaxID=1492 RepID=UPI0013CFF7CD|nr:HK97 gp10 family phage protein [Clostridium butyricum]MCQ2017475.1 HK97 gp10 family phage protein [Clostridium butyricum]MCQ2022727.1 HK97 gp10 family phage protein [Clostridium butyricum]NFB71952.1 HK97 gp10 family phage protein [Clostridium butyricum]NFB91916.1 HK97 gp10 family phage protein [Clostridium butyricum]UTY53318.1 HK97 gp10 family phage protein [Clostridium butyricum]